MKYLKAHTKCVEGACKILWTGLSWERRTVSYPKRVAGATSGKKYIKAYTK